MSVGRILTRYLSTHPPSSSSSSSSSVPVASPPKVRGPGPPRARQRPVRPRQLRLLRVHHDDAAFRAPRTYRPPRRLGATRRRSRATPDWALLRGTIYAPGPASGSRPSPRMCRPGTPRLSSARARGVRRHEPDVGCPGERALEVEPLGSRKVHLVHQEERLRLLAPSVRTGLRRRRALAQRGPPRRRRRRGPVPDADEVVVRGVARRPTRRGRRLPRCARPRVRSRARRNIGPTSAQLTPGGAHDRGDLYPGA